MYMYGLTKDEYIGLLKEYRKNKKKGISKLFTK